MKPSTDAAMTSPLPHPTPATPASHCLLHLALPLGLEEALLDSLQSLPGPAPELILVRSETLGADVPLASPLEQVLGRARSRIVQLLLPQAEVTAWLDQLRQAGAPSGLRWWTTPVLDCGSLA